MSVQAISHVFQNPTEHASMTLVWLAMADSVNDLHEYDFWMSNLKLQEKTGLSESTVRRALQALVETGRIEDLGGHESGTNLYRFQFDTPVNLKEKGCQVDTPPGVTVTPNTELVTQGNPTGAKSISEELWDALCFACKINSAEVTKTGRGELNSAVKELKAVGATPREIIRRAVVWKQKYPEIRVTPSALKKHWAALEPVDRGVVEIYPGASQEVPVGAQTLSPEEKERNQARVRELSERFHAGLRD